MARVPRVARRFAECTFAVVDVETTGIDAAVERIVEVAVVTCEPDGTVVERFETLVRPDGGTPAGNHAEMVRDAPAFGDVAGDVVARLSGAVVAGHNVAFDLRFLDAELGRLGHRLPTQRYVCTRELATVLGCDVANRTLASLCAFVGVPFERWHTAGDDAEATARVLGRLLERADSFGRSTLASVCSLWQGPVTIWPALAAGGRRLVRDPARWPPSGDQPGSKRAREPSFRRLGDGPVPGARRSGVVFVAGGSPADEPWTPALANGAWWSDDLRGLDGIQRLEEVIVPAFRGAGDPELGAALCALADLLRRHGGRDAEVRALLDEAFTLTVRRGDVAGAAAAFRQWWAHLAALRDTGALAALAAQAFEVGPAAGVDAAACVLEQIEASARLEPLVAVRLGRAAAWGFAATRAPGGADAAGEVLLATVVVLDRLGDVAGADVLLEDAYGAGWRQLTVVDALSGRLERAGAHERALEVCGAGLAAGRKRGSPSPLLDSIRRRHRRCQAAVARSATLFA